MQSWLSNHAPALATTAASLAAVGGVALWWALTHRKSAEERERLRREHLVLHGRIIDGSVLDWSEQPNSSDLGTLMYHYSIGGVGYECAQDLTFLKGTALVVDPNSLGRPASVRYDPKNPANSIIVAEGWTGLQHPNRILVPESLEATQSPVPIPPAVK
ncbi:MAG TPA: hypothetical protein VFN62_02335 [Acidobacteriaceae bacterium]|nr:hypothetical protein [Acidobacteriaceae bacterium]